MQTDGDDAYETLMQFLYRAPVALMQLRQDGEIEMLNPMAAQLLMPLSPDGELASLFKVLEARARTWRSCAPVSRRNMAWCAKAAVSRCRPTTAGSRPCSRSGC
jgi:hypothetical protein